MAQIEININDYLSEEEKKEIVIEMFRQQVKKELFKSIDGTVKSDSEIQRVIGNISHSIVMNEVQKYIPDCESMIKDKVINTLTNKELSYQVFKKKDVWDKDESLAIKYMNEAITDCKELFQNRIKDTIENYDLSKDISENISDEFNKMADTIYNLSELFKKKDN